MPEIMNHSQFLVAMPRYLGSPGSRLCTAAAALIINSLATAFF